MATTHGVDPPFGFSDEDFVIESYDEYPSGFRDLQNENLFPKSKFPMFRGKDTSAAAQNAYESIQPALLLLSRIIIQCWESFTVFVRRQRPGLFPPDEFLDADTELALSKDETIGYIKNVIPDIEFNPDRHYYYSNSAAVFAETVLCPKAASDRISVDYNIVRLLRDPTCSHSRKLAGLVFLAVLLGHGLAHVLEFRSIRGGQLLRSDDDGEPLNTPGVTCREAGTAWETRAFGGRIYPICGVENSLVNMRGLCISSNAWNFDMMKANEKWIRELFRESHWTTTTAVHPLRAPIGKYARFALLEDELLIDYERRALPTEGKGCERDVRVETGSIISPRKKHRQIIPVNICGAKRVR